MSVYIDQNNLRNPAKRNNYPDESENNLFDGMFYFAKIGDSRPCEMSVVISSNLDIRYYCGDGTYKQAPPLIRFHQTLANCFILFLNS